VPDRRHRFRVLGANYLARIPGTSDAVSSFDLQRYSIWVTTASLWGLAFTTALFTSVAAIKVPQLDHRLTIEMAVLTFVIGAVISLLP
jgi:hypothetical protein